MTTWCERDVQRFAEAIIRADRWQLATFARWKYRSEGRGLVAVTVRGEPPRTLPQVQALKIGYRSLAEYQRITSAAPAAMRPHVAHTVDLIETYDPEQEMVVSVVCGPTFLTVTCLERLEIPVAVDAAAGVH